MSKHDPASWPLPKAETAMQAARREAREATRAEVDTTRRQWQGPMIEGNPHPGEPWLNEADLARRAAERQRVKDRRAAREAEHVTATLAALTDDWAWS